MKNTYIKPLFFLTSLALMLACEEENVRDYTGDLSVYFAESNYSSIQVFEVGAVIEDGITVTLVGSAATTDTTIDLQVDPESTAVSGTHYNLVSGTSLTIPAGEYSATLPFEVILDGFTGPEDTKTLIFNIISSSVEVVVNHSSVIATLGYVCPSELLGTVDYSIINSTADIAPLVGSTGTLEWSGGEIGDNGTEYIWSTFTFGAYQLLYACCEREGGNDATLYVNDFCDDISFSGADDFGCTWELDVVSVSGTVLTVNVFSSCMGTLVVEMTRQDGNDWPSLM